MKCLKFGGKCVQECDHYPCNVLKAYNQALEDFIDKVCGLRQYNNDLNLNDLLEAKEELLR